MSRDTLYQYYPQAIPPELCELISKAGSILDINSGTVKVRTEHEVEVEHNIRNTCVGFWDRESWVNGLLSHYASHANRTIWGFDLVMSQGVQFGIYDSGSHYDWHKDEFDLPVEAGQNPDWVGLNRKLTACAALNGGEEYAGGDFQIKNAWGEIIDIPAMRQQGSVIVLPAYVLHRVTEVTDGTRKSIVSWFMGPQFR